jgi:zinc finger SWIM domain-containing protein 3
MSVVLQDSGPKKGKEFVLKDICDQHNHEVLKSIIERHPKRRKLGPEDEEVALQALKLKSNKKLLQQAIKKKTNKYLKLKDLTNLQQKSKQRVLVLHCLCHLSLLSVFLSFLQSPDTLQGLLDYLNSEQRHRNLDIEVSHDNEHITGIMLMDPIMKECYSSYPEVVLMDATYKLVDSRMALYILITIDGNGESDIVTFFLVKNESHATLLGMMKSFAAKFSPETIARTRVALTDKDFTERSVLSEIFPSASLHLCLFHTLRTFGREVTTVKMSLRPEQRDTALSMLERLAYSRNEDEYDRNLKILEGAEMPLVLSYYMANWHEERNQWVVGLRSQTLTLSQNTTNRLENVNKHIKAVVTKFSSLPEFFSSFFLYLDSMRDEKNHRTAHMLELPVHCSNAGEAIFRKKHTMLEKLWKVNFKRQARRKWWNALMGSR